MTELDKAKEDGMGWDGKYETDFFCLWGFMSMEMWTHFGTDWLMSVTISTLSLKF